MTRRRQTASRAGLLLLVLLTGCPMDHSTRHRDTVERDSALLAGSADTVYDRRIRALQRRAATAPADSLARLYAAIPSTPDSLLGRVQRALERQTLCIIRSHGNAAFLRAHDRVVDSLIRTGFDFGRHEPRMAGAPAPPVDIEANGPCGVVGGLPDSISQEPPPPRWMRPRRQ